MTTTAERRSTQFRDSTMLPWSDDPEPLSVRKLTRLYSNFCEISTTENSPEAIVFLSAERMGSSESLSGAADLGLFHRVLGPCPRTSGYEYTAVTLNSLPPGA